MYLKKDIEEQLKIFIKNSTTDTYKLYFDDGTHIDYHISFNYQIESRILTHNENNPLMKISNFSQFIDKLTVLINLMAEFHINDKSYFEFSDKNYLDYLLVSCFSNMNEYDLNYPFSYLERLIEAYSYKCNFHEEKTIGTFDLNNKSIEVKEVIGKNIASMEAPLYKQFVFSYNGEKVFSPKVNFYISDGKCYIMSIQNKKHSDESYLAKNLDRYFRKFDKGLEHIERSNNGDISTVKDISPNALAALTLFLSTNKKLSRFLFPSLLPLRYMNKVGTLNKRKIDESEANRIQSNLTNRLLLTGARICEHFDSSKYDLLDNSFMELEFNPKFNSVDNIIFQLYNTTNRINKKS